ncbi:S1C family serine protease [Paenibacillus chungangensis]|uniref:S1C family serine protease n=1 Tax=Paenibacillus chungangensis TaxID=696535 RepID=A0ABW3HW94_9BACL
MSLFDDDFFSTRVSRRTVRKYKKKEEAVPKWGQIGEWSTIRIALVSSFVSAVGACLLFGFIFGFGGGADRASVPAGSASIGSDPSEWTIHATAKVRPAVVSIINEQKFSLGLGSKKIEGDMEEGVLREAGVGSGVIIEKRDGKAYIVTNYHVVAGAEKVKAVIMNGEVREADIVGEDPITDLAVLEIDSKGVDTVAEIGDSSKLREAEFVIAIGNPLGMGKSTTLGVVSVTKEVVPVSLNGNGMMDWEQEVIRVDAAINEGNSGGPLIDLDGRVVGINSMKIADFGVESIGYAIPINNAIPIINSLIDQGYVPRPYLGVYTMDLEHYWGQQSLEKFLQEEFPEDESADGEKKEDEAPSDDDSESQGGGGYNIQVPDNVYNGVIVLEAVGPALEAGLQMNDIIVKLDEEEVRTTRELRRYLYNKKKIGEDITVSYYRGSELQSLKLKLSDREEE